MYKKPSAYKRPSTYKRLSTILVLLAAAGVLLASEQHLPMATGDDRPGDRDAIRAHIDTIFKAYMRKDRETIRATHTDAWRGFLTSTRSIIRGIDEYMESAERSLGGAGRIFSYEMKEFDVLFYGNVALVPYVADMEVGVADVRTSVTLRVLDVYADLDGHWIQIASNTAYHPDTDAAYRQELNPLLPLERDLLLAEREALWRAWFANDRERLEAMLPENAEDDRRDPQDEPHHRQDREQAQVVSRQGGRVLVRDDASGRVSGDHAGVHGSRAVAA